ncbi:MAG: hypothetical protein IJY20_01765 [Clostridia bacterium]|nr:hypothetical protein [Clostridia bacterium]
MVNEWNKKMKELLDGAKGEEEKKKNYLTDSGYQPENEDLLPGIGGEEAEEHPSGTTEKSEGGEAQPFPNLITDPHPWREQIKDLFSGTLDKETDRNYLTDSGYQPTNKDLLPGIGSPLPNISRPEEEAEKAKAETDNAIREALKTLADRLAGGETASETESESALRTEASDRFAASDALRENATEKGDTLYDALLSFAGKQDGRYDALIDQISQKGYRDFAGVSDILSSYAAQGDRAAGYAAAGGAIENGGNPDSYAAAQAARKRLDFTEAGNAAALSYYNDQLDRWLSTLQAAGSDATDIYALMQDNVDSTHAAATEEGKRGEGLFASLADLQSTRAEADADQFSSLLSHYTKVKEEEGEKIDKDAISPMEIDREYEAMLAGEGQSGTALTSTDALIALWQKYPTMREYLLEKYDKILNPDYVFKG